MPRTLFECGLTDAILYWTDVCGAQSSARLPAVQPRPSFFLPCSTQARATSLNRFSRSCVLSQLRPCSVLVGKLIGRQD